MECRYSLATIRGKLPQGQSSLGFGKLRTDHMFLIDYQNGEWKSPRIVPYGNLLIAPGATALHYSQEIFEGAKAFYHADGNIYAWRLDENAKRLNNSALCMCMPEIPVKMQIEAMTRLIDIDRDWCPKTEGSSLYIRPFMIGLDDCIHVNASKSYLFGIILSPSEAYYSGGFGKPIKLLITEKFHRAAPGGTGSAKTGGNYAASLLPAAHASSCGAEQVLYLDVTNTYIEEAGSMNHVHVLKDGTFIIPEFGDSVLQSITSKSILELAKKGTLKARQEKIRIDDFIAKIKNGEIIEAGGLGTAAVVSPVGKYIFEDGRELLVGDGKVGKHLTGLHSLYTDMQLGKISAPKDWLFCVENYSF